jgi:catechol 2,3-dioxygenase-like lactoylglutathione lyase family enzyme
MAFAQEYAITDICLLVKDTQRSIDFYVDKLGFEINRRAESFVEFNGAGLTLACWEIDHLSDNTGVSNAKAEGPHKACIAVRVPSPEAVDASYAELKDKGVAFYGEPADYVWNARGAYFIGPDDELWEIYAWKDGGSMGNF